MMNKEDLVQFSDGVNTLQGRWSIPDGTENYPLVVLATGDSPSGSKGQTWQQLVPMLNACGIATFLFDFSGLGNSPGVYRELTLSLGCNNFRGVIEYVSNNGGHNRDRIGAIGASYGGNVILLEAAKLPQIKVIGLKSPSTFLPEGYQLQYGAELMETWSKDGYSETVGLNYQAVIDSLFHNTYLAARDIKVPVRIVHGTRDSAVPIRHVRDLIKIIPNGSILEIPGADHWYAEGNEWEQMANNLVHFIVDNL
jgi:dipeptidyl aminopeptidase/acylaminoacyl peptidase